LEIKLNGKNILNDIQKGNYGIGLVRQYEYIASNGKKRIVSQMNSVDRLIMHVLNFKLSEVWNSFFFGILFCIHT